MNPVPDFLTLLEIGAFLIGIRVVRILFAGVILKRLIFYSKFIRSSLNVFSKCAIIFSITALLKIMASRNTIEKIKLYLQNLCKLTLPRIDPCNFKLKLLHYTPCLYFTPFFLLFAFFLSIFWKRNFMPFFCRLVLGKKFSKIHL